MEKILRISLLLILLPFFTYSQLVIQGVVKDTSNKPIVSANVVLKDSINNIITYAITNNTGIYKITKFKYSKNNYTLQASHISYEKKQKVLSLDKSAKLLTINFVLENKGTNLGEVLITAKKKSFIIKKDTITYNVKAYSNDSDRKIQDVISKLPGIDVNIDTGEIKYKGKSIETVLLEGDDLFGYNYSLGTKNINVDMVKQIEAIENYSENPLLKGIENGDKVALNLKLKKNKTDFSGNIDFGFGIYDKEKQAFDINSNIVGISKKYKSFATLAYNNIGINHSPFDYFGFNANLERQKEKDFFTQKVIPETRFSSELNYKRMNINNQYFGNYNAIFKLNKRFKIKTNFYYVNDKIINNRLLQNTYILDNANFTTSDDYIIKKKPEQYRGDLELKYNTSKTSLIEYYLKIRKENIETPSSILSNQDNNFNALLNSNDYYLKQKLLFTKKISQRKVLQTSIRHSTNNISQKYQLYPSVIDFENFDFDMQRIKSVKNYLEAKTTILGITKKKNNYAFSVGILHDDNLLQSNLISTNLHDNIIKEDAVNDSKYLNIHAYQLGIYYFNLKNWVISPEYAIKYLYQNINDNNRINSQTNFFISPTLSVKYNINNSSFITGKIEFSQTPKGEKYIYGNRVLINNRTFISNNSSLDLQKSTSYGIFYFKNDMYNQLQLNFNINYLNSKGNFFTKSFISNNSSHINYFYLPQKNDDWYFNFLIAKYIPLLKSTTKLSSNYSISQYKNIINESKLRTNKINFFSTKLFIKTAFKGWINFENIINLTKSTSKSENNNSFINKSLNNNFKIILKPVKEWSILFTSDYFLPNMKNGMESYLFIDASLRHRLKNKKVEFYFTAKNLLNEKKFERVQVTDFSTSIYRTNILPRYYLLSATYNF